MAREVDADRALTEEQNWSAREHRELYEAVHTGNEPGRIGELAREWTRLGTELGEAAETATRRVRATEQGWQGAAADAARTALQRVLDWSRDAGATAHSVGDQLDHQGRIMEAAKTSMPEPVEPDPGPKRFAPDGPKDLAGLAGAAEDGRARQERSRAAHDQAVEVMRRMETDSRQVDGSTPRFEPPPNPIQDSAPAPKPAGQDGQSDADSGSQQASPQEQNGQQPNAPQGTAPSAAPAAPAPPAGPATPNAPGPEAGRPPVGDQGVPTTPVASKVGGSGSGKQGAGSGGTGGKKDQSGSKSDDSKGSKDSKSSGKDDSGGNKSDSHDGSPESEKPKSTHSSSAAPAAEQTARLTKPPMPEGGPRPQSFSPAASGGSAAGWSGSLPQPSAGGGSSGAGSSAGGGRAGGSGGPGESLSPGDRTGSGAARGSSPAGGAPSAATPAGGQAGMTGMAGSPGAGGMAGRGQGQQEQSHSSKYVEGDEELFEVPGDPPPPVIGARKQERQQGRGE